MGNLMTLGSEASLAEGFAGFFREKLKPYANLSILQMALKYLSPTQTICQGCHPLKKCLWLRQDLLSKAKPTTCLLDTIPTKLLKAYPEVFLPLITRLLNLS